MLEMKSLLIALFAVSIAPQVSAGKLAILKRELHSSCPDAKITKPELIKAVRKAFLLCSPMSTVDIKDNCKIHCLKPMRGNVIGGMVKNSESMGREL